MPLLQDQDQWFSEAARASSALPKGRCRVTDAILGLSLIALALLVAIRSHREKRRRATMRRVLEPYAIDMFPREPRERHVLTPLDMAIVHDLVKDAHETPRQDA
jgi:hypothetical protein